MSDVLLRARYYIKCEIECYIKEFAEEISVSELDRGIMSIEEFIDEVMVELIRYGYQKYEERYSVRRHLKEMGIVDDDAKRMMYTRIIAYALNYKKSEIKQVEDFYGKSINEIVSNYKEVSMDDIETKLGGYELNKLQFFSYTTMLDLPIIKSIVEKRLENTKKVSNDNFRNMMLGIPYVIMGYEDFVRQMKAKSKMSKDELLLYSLAYWEFQWKYPIELWYTIVMYLEEKNYTKFATEKLGLLCAQNTFFMACKENKRVIMFTTNSRFVKKRNDFVNKLEDAGETYENKMKVTLQIYLQIKAKIMEKGSILKEWFADVSTKEDWVDFLYDYDIFSIHQEKEWTNYRIKMMRKLMKTCSEK